MDRAVIFFFTFFFKKKENIGKRERENGTQVGVMIGAGAANTGLFWMRLGGAGEAGELRRADMEGRNVALFCGDWAWEREVRHQLFIVAVDIGSAPDYGVE